PHWTCEGGIYAVTFRLADALPAEVLLAWEAEREAIPGRAAAGGRELTPAERHRLEQLHSAKIQQYLDAGHGECWLRRPEIAQTVSDALLRFNGERYELFTWCIMPNHVHVVVRPIHGAALPDILYGWKSYSALACNRILGRSGAFWQVEYYDHLIRDEAELYHAMGYAWSNPQQAGLESWPHRFR